MCRHRKNRVSGSSLLTSPGILHGPGCSLIKRGMSQGGVFWARLLSHRGHSTRTSPGRSPGGHGVCPCQQPELTTQRHGQGRKLCSAGLFCLHSFNTNDQHLESVELHLTDHPPQASLEAWDLGSLKVSVKMSVGPLEVLHTRPALAWPHSALPLCRWPPSAGAGWCLDGATCPHPMPQGLTSACFFQHGATWLVVFGIWGLYSNANKSMPLRCPDP